MNLVKRAWKSTVRQLAKSLTLLIILIILGSFAAGAISISRAIQTTELNLRRRIPAVATIIQDNDSLFDYIDTNGDWPDWDFSLTTNIIESIGYLPYVKIFDYAFIGENFFSRELMLPMNPEPYLKIGLDESVILNQLQSLSLGIDAFEQFILKGVYNTLVADIEADIIELIEGRTFREEEIQSATPVAIVSQAFVETNNLRVGTTFVLEQHIFDWNVFNNYRYWRDFYHDGNIIVSESLEIEVIGIFTPTVAIDENSNLVELTNHMQLNNLIYVPMGVAKQPEYLWLSNMCGNYLEQCYFSVDFIYQDITFILYDSLYLDNFGIAASELLPYFWVMDDLTHTFRDMSASLETLRNTVNWIILGIVMASFTVLSLLITLFLWDRKHEIGVYLALGERKRYIIYQMIIEVIAISAVSILISLFIGNFTARNLSQTMLQNEMMANATLQNFDMNSLNDLNRMGLGFWMTHEEMIETYSVSLDKTIILIFIGTATLMVLISTIIPTIYLTKLKPKDILLKAHVE